MALSTRDSTSSAAIRGSPTPSCDSPMSSYPNDPAHAESTTPPDSGSAPSHAHDAPERPPSNDHDDDPAKKKKGTKRRKVNHACLYCRRSHMTCDEGRPCQRWYAVVFPPPSLSRTGSACARRPCALHIALLNLRCSVQYQARDRPPVPRRAAFDAQGQRLSVKHPRTRPQPPSRRRAVTPWQASLALPPSSCLSS